MEREILLHKTEQLLALYRTGKLGGERMPEDANPGLAIDSRENYLYFTLPMALNYRRSSYALWESALKTWNDPETHFVFEPAVCPAQPFEAVQHALTKYGVALQKQKQTEIWLSLCKTFTERFDGDVRRLFDTLDNDVERIRRYMQVEQKKAFPYLSGTKLCNYWLYVILQYTDRRYINPGALTVAPDTHVCRATCRLGLITEAELESSHVQNTVIERWQTLLQGTDLSPIHVHTPLWLWSRSGFIPLE